MVDMMEELKKRNMIISSILKNNIEERLNKREQTMYVYLEEVDDYETLVPKDIEQAKYWWKKAAAQGNEVAKERLQKIYQ